MSTLMLVLAATGAVAPSSPPAWITSVVEAGRFRGDVVPRVIVKQAAFPPDADQAMFVAVVTEAMCLMNPAQFPPEFGIEATAYSPAHPIVSAVRDADLWLEKRSREGAKDDDTEAVRQHLAAKGFFQALWTAYERDSQNAASCLNQALPRVHEAIAARSSRAALPAEEQWKTLVGMCNGPEDSLEEHIAFRFDHPRVTKERSNALRDLTRTGWFNRCLVDAIAADPDLTMRVLKYNSMRAYADTERVRRDAWQKWEALGVPAAIEELALGSAGPAVERLRTACAAVPAAKIGPS